jgi:peptidoglycan/LPS O-acetylase OafA/YrhL
MDTDSHIDDSAGARMSGAMEARVIPAINGLRAIAVMMLVVGHYSDRVSHLAPIWMPTLANYSITVFFVLTGFIATEALIREHRATGEIRVGHWLGRKALRIYPTIVAMLVVATVTQQVKNGHEVPIGRYLGFLGMVGNYYYALAHSDLLRHTLGHLWSIYVGAHFLVVWMLVVRWAARRDRLDDLIAPLLLLILVSTGLRDVMIELFGASEAYVYLSTETRVAEIAIGAIALLVIRCHGNRLPARLAAHPLGALLGIVTIMALFHTEHPLGPPLRASGTALAMVYAVSLNGRGLVGRILGSRLLDVVSAISFSIFAWHLYGLAFHSYLDSIALWIRIPAVMAITLTIGAIMYTILEYYPRRWADRIRVQTGG